MPDSHNLPIGKLPPDLLAQLLAPLAPRDRRVFVGARPGEDAAVVEMGTRLLVAAADPITFASDAIGRYAVAVNANDVAVRGATPRWFLATLLLPPGTTAEAVHAIMNDLAAACREMEIDLIGGHTEITDAVTRPVISGTMLGEAPPERLVTSSGARPGDALLLGGALAVEGTAVLAREAAAALASSGVSAETITRARDLLREPGISVTGMARALCDAVHPHAMHDPTEGGLATALAELAAASGCGIHLAAPESLPVLPATRQFCDALGLDPLGLLASGALLAAVAPPGVERALAALNECGAGGVVIGRVTPAADGLTMATPHGLTMATPHGQAPLPAFARDELARWLEGSPSNHQSP